MGFPFVDCLTNDPKICSDTQGMDLMTEHPEKFWEKFSAGAGNGINSDTEFLASPSSPSVENEARETAKIIF